MAINESKFAKKCMTATAEMLDAIASTSEEFQQHIQYAEECAESAVKAAQGTKEFIVAVDLYTLIRKVKDYGP